MGTLFSVVHPAERVMLATPSVDPNNVNYCKCLSNFFKVVQRVGFYRREVVSRDSQKGRGS